MDGVGDVGRNIKLNDFIYVIVIVAVVRTLHGVLLFSGFVGLQRA